MNKVGFAIIVFGLIVMLAAANFLSTTLGSGLCGNKIEQEIRSPNGELKAVIFSRDCGAGINFSSNVSVLNASDSVPDTTGNVLVQEKSAPQVSWETNNNLLIRYESKVPIQSKQDSVWVMRLPLPQQIAVRYSSL